MNVRMKNVTSDSYQQMKKTRTSEYNIYIITIKIMAFRRMIKAVV